MEESGVTKVISVRLENESGPPEPIADPVPYEEEDVEYEEGRELPIGVDDPALINEDQLRPIRSGLTFQEAGTPGAAPAETETVKADAGEV
jgi:chromosome segregation protein